MNVSRIPLGMIAASLLVAVLSPTASAEKHKWNNPDNERRYKEALRNSEKAYKAEAAAHDAEVRTIDKNMAGARVVKKGADAGVEVVSRVPATGPAGGAVRGSYKAATGAICRGKKCD